MILNRSSKLRFSLIIAFILLFISYQYSGLKYYLKANNITYRVQISAAYQNKIPIESLVKRFSIEESIREDYHKGWFKYSIGNFPDYYDARGYRDKLIANNKTYGAFVVLIKDDIRMDGMDTVQPQTAPTLQTMQKVSYRIQIKASNNQISVADLKTQLAIAEEITEEKINNWYKYTIGNFENYDDAKNLFHRVINIDKINDAFIVTYYGNKRVGYQPIEKKPTVYKEVVSTSKIEQKPVVKATPKPRVIQQKKTVQQPQIVEKQKPAEKAKPAEIPKQEPVAEIIEPSSVDIILFHINSDRLKGTTKKPLTVISENETGEYESQKIAENETKKEPENIEYKEPDQNNQPILSQETDVESNTSYQSNYVYSDTSKSAREYRNRNFLSKFVDKIRFNSKKSFFIWLLLILIIYFIVNLIVVITIVFISRVRKIRKERKIKKIEDEFQLLLAEFLFDTNNEREAYNKLRSTSGSFKRNILVDELMKLCVDLSGEVLEKLKELYFAMELNKDSLSRLKDNRWFVKVKACRELTRMKAYEAKKEIEKLLDSKNEILRAEAQMALIELSEENPYYFLEKLTKPFLPWEQLNVHVMMQRNSYEIPDFSKWLMLENETVVLFAIEMIRVYRQIMNAPKIIKFFKHPNPMLKEAAIITAGELGYVEVVPELIKIYNEVEDEFKVLILRSMQRLADDTNKDFLRNILESSAAQYIKLDAAKAMFAIGIKGQIELKRYSQTDDAELNAIIKHVFDERI